jgi:hypothetical protein
MRPCIQVPEKRRKNSLSGLQGRAWRKKKSKSLRVLFSIVSLLLGVEDTDLLLNRLHVMKKGGTFVRFPPQKSWRRHFQNT